MPVPTPRQQHAYDAKINQDEASAQRERTYARARSDSATRHDQRSRDQTLTGKERARERTLLMASRANEQRGLQNASNFSLSALQHDSAQLRLRRQDDARFNDRQHAHFTATTAVPLNQRRQTTYNRDASALTLHQRNFKADGTKK